MRNINEIKENILRSNKEYFSIYQLKDTIENRGYRFSGTRQLNKLDPDKNIFEGINYENYNLLYISELVDYKRNDTSQTLENIFEIFNIGMPADFKGHSLSVSDIIVLHTDDQDNVYYVDSYGFTKLDDFLKETLIRETATKKSKDSIVEQFKLKTDNYFQKIDGIDARTIENIVKDYVEHKIKENDFDMVVQDIVLVGSRCRGIETENSDLDIVVSYTGEEREDTVFNLLHEDQLCISNVLIDINPITEAKTGTIENYLQSVETYLEEKTMGLEQSKYENNKKNRDSVKDKLLKKQQENNQTKNNNHTLKDKNVFKENYREW